MRQMRIFSDIPDLCSFSLDSVNTERSFPFFFRIRNRFPVFPMFYGISPLC
jgi:hypothetical protein